MSSQSYLIATSTGAGAVSAHFIALSVELQRRGHRVAILTDTPNAKINVTPASGTIYEWPSPRPGRLRDAGFLMSVVSRHKPDCAIANYGAVNLVTVLHWIKRVPLRIVWYHTLSSQLDIDSSLSPLRLLWLRRRKSLIYSTATHIFANSNASKEDARLVYGVPGSKCFVQTLSLADPFGNGQPNGAPRRTNKITCAGRFWPSKGQATLVRALAKLPPEQDWEAVFLGDGPSRPEVEKLAAELGIAGRCRFTGNCPHDMVLEEMSTATLNVVPSLVEAFGFVAVETLALGLPIIASKTGGLAEIVRDEIDGFLVPPGDADALSQKLGILLSNPELARTMGAQARERFLSEFERSRVIPRQVDWLEGVHRASQLKREQKYSPSAIP